MDIKMLTNVLPVATVAAATIFSYATLSATAESNTDDIERNQETLEKHEEKIDTLEDEVIRLASKTERIEEVTQETKDDVKEVLLILRREATL